ncbi:MAG: ABC transporter ATP-binding protein [Candidatus Thorarchaeota archaeon]|nr:ABC transporter ATP-binding protein [Candidatus Thorarchaeota archaeon]
MSIAIDIRHVCFSYDDFQLADITTRLRAGEQKALVGLNGSGKTTLFKLILGLLRPVSGEIEVFGKPVRPDTLWQIRQEVGFMFQNPDDQLFAPTVWDDVSFGPKNMGLSPEEVRERVSWSLDAVGLSELAQRPIGQMSFGQAKRAALAGVLAMRPRVLLLDEPFAGIDFPMIEAVIDIVNALRKEGVAVFYTTHDRFFLEHWADSMTVLGQGQVVYDGPPAEGLEDPDVVAQIGDWERLARRLDHRP